MNDKTAARIDWDRRHLVKELRRQSPDHPQAEYPGSTDGLDSEQLAMREAADTIEALMAEAKNVGFRLAPSPAQPTEAGEREQLALVILTVPFGIGHIGETPALRVADAILAAGFRLAPIPVQGYDRGAWGEGFAAGKASVSSPVQGADDRLAQVEAIGEQAGKLQAFLIGARSSRLLPRGWDELLTEIQDALFATYQQSPQAALNEVRARAWKDAVDWARSCSGFDADMAADYIEERAEARAAELRGGVQAGDES